MSFEVQKDIIRAKVQVNSTGMPPAVIDAPYLTQRSATSTTT
jgi:hypothetical protein